MSAPIAYDTTRYRCPHCRRSFASKSYAGKHVLRCLEIPDEPGPEVKTVRDRFGQDFERIGDVWVGRVFESHPDVPDLELQWRQLFLQLGPLTDVTEAPS